MDPVERYFEIAALCNGIHSKVGTGRGQIPNEDEPKPNWSLMLRSWRIEKNHLGGQGDSGAGEVMAWLICGVNARANSTTTGQWDRRVICTATAARRRAWYGAVASGSARQKRQRDIDAEVTAGQAVAQRTSSQQEVNGHRTGRTTSGM